MPNRNNLLPYLACLHEILCKEVAGLEADMDECDEFKSVGLTQARAAAVAELDAIVGRLEMAKSLLATEPLADVQRTYYYETGE